MSLVKVSLPVLEANVTQTREGSRIPTRLKSEKDVPLSHNKPGQSGNMYCYMLYVIERGTGSCVGGCDLGP